MPKAQDENKAQDFVNLAGERIRLDGHSCISAKPLLDAIKKALKEVNEKQAVAIFSHYKGLILRCLPEFDVQLDEEKGRAIVEFTITVELTREDGEWVIEYSSEGEARKLLKKIEIETLPITNSK